MSPTASQSLPATSGAQVELLDGAHLKRMLARYIVADLEDAIAQVEAMLTEAADPNASVTNAEELERRELAEAIVAGAWLNRDNPDWNPADPSTHMPAKNDPLLAILGA